jgi:hypothetical protein
MVEESITYSYSLEIMTVESQIDRVTSAPFDRQLEQESQDRTRSIDPPNDSPQPDPVLCPHCLRTASNGIKCKGLCVADSDY